MPKGRFGSPLGSSSYVRLAGAEIAPPPPPPSSTTYCWQATVATSSKHRSERIQTSGQGSPHVQARAMPEPKSLIISELQREHARDCHRQRTKRFYCE